MVDRNLLREYDVSDEELEKEISESLKESEAEDLTRLLQKSSEQAEVGRIVVGRVVDVVNEMAIIDVGHKSEGVVPLSEWGENEPKPKPGDTVEVLLEGLEDDGGEVILSKRKAARIRAWERILRECKVGDVVVGKVTRKIKGGLLVDIGVNVFLPASQVDVRRPGDVAEFIGQTIECKILKIDVGRRNIVVSRRKLIEEQREELKQQLLNQLREGDIVRGTVKNIADFGAFIDLGGIDGLLHITDMSWGRISDPSEVVKLDQEIDVKVLHIDREREKIALGLKQLTPSPWEQVPLKYPVGSKVRGKVVNIVNYGAFVKLEDGVEGLVHISEMSWTKRVNHPSELVKVGDEVDVVVLGINEDKQEISLGMKQAHENPWDRIDEKYPIGSVVKGVVRNCANYGAFVELEEGIEGLLHVSDLSWTQKINHPNEVLKKGKQIECKVLDIDRE
ncbi:MAG TPA: 30S ribosomal protein S1, partial [Planctomycetaceae bacterium]|nr:30S ribosomal protein S1 [Planctomycetaceae bacterium]